MEQKLRFTGQMPDNWEKALAELRDELGIVSAAEGVEAVCVRGEELAVVCDGASVRITWQTPVQFYRALSLIPLPLAPCGIRQKPRFRTVGVMFDCSRNAVLRPDAVRFFLRKMALMGLSLCMLYTEDTYAIPEQPFFGYKRGRYTFDELKALDDYAHLFGIEMCPCIQTLGHLKRALHWPAMEPLRDNEEVLLADQDETYAFIEQMIRAASAPFRSKRIHIGMDEAYGVGLGEHLRRFRYEDPHAIMGRHLRRVLDITDKYGLEPMMWSDMYFHLDGHDYHSGGMPSRKAMEAVDPRVCLVYWDYYSTEQEQYAAVLEKHRALSPRTAFAGGLWTWAGPAPAYPLAIGNTAAGLAACMEAGVDCVIATAWGDNGAETSLLAALPGMQLYGEIAYTGVYDGQALAARFRRCCGAELAAFLDLSLLNAAPGMAASTKRPVNLCKSMLYQDPLVELFAADTDGLRLAEHYASLVPLYERHSRENPAYGLLFEHYTALARLLALKCRWHEDAAPAVWQGDRQRAAALADGLTDALAAAEALRQVWRRLWEAVNRPNGFEVIDARLGGVMARLKTAQDKMRAFAAGEAADIPELAEPSLRWMRAENGSFLYINNMEQIASPSCLN